MTTTQATLTVDLYMHVTKSDRHWVGICEDLGLVVHGSSETEAFSHLMESLSILLGAVGDDADEMQQYLDHHHIRHSIAVAPKSTAAPSSRTDYLLSCDLKIFVRS